MNLYQRRQTNTVFVGQIGVGGNHPIRLQSMTTSDTKDTVAVVREIKQLVEAGCEIVRLTVPTIKDCENLKNIRREMRSQNLFVPLVADIHFTPSLALQVVEYVEKVRINPGNFVDKKLFKKFEISDADYQEELARIEEKFIPLVLKCKEHGVAMRIGTNHGSLSDRIMNRYGDTPQGMVESAIEFLKIAEAHHYHNIILSMKASNTQVMVTAYRELVKKMNELGMRYPLHLGVTEAGEGEDGRIKSALGIGTLLEEGIGDTIRVSLTEDSQHEIPVAAMLTAPYNLKIAQENWHKELNTFVKPTLPLRPHRLSYQRRASLKHKIGPVYHGDNEPVRVWTQATTTSLDQLKQAVDFDFSFEGVEFNPTDYSAAQVEFCQKHKISVALCSNNTADFLQFTGVDKYVWVVKPNTPVDLITQQVIDFSELKNQHIEVCFDCRESTLAALEWHDFFNKLIKRLQDHNPLTNIGFSFLTQHHFFEYKILADVLENLNFPALLHLRYVGDSQLPAQLHAAIKIGGFLIDGVGDSIQIQTSESDKTDTRQLSYNILQASRVRISKTEFISCPSCGRTQFDLQTTTERIRSKTGHLKGVKIAIMGCIVNGPGEMADADFGYVGTGPEKISLYVGKDCVERNLHQSVADEKLIELIKKHGMWVETK